jgi:hypothetical protein
MSKPHATGVTPRPVGGYVPVIRRPTKSIFVELHCNARAYNKLPVPSKKRQTMRGCRKL